MLPVSDQFEAHATGNLRPISQRVLVSFSKTFDDLVDFFTLDSSELDGTDILQGTGSVVQEWDKYEYTDYSERVISVEWSREQENPWSLSLGIADVTFDNTDDFFTPGAGSVISDEILPRRPIRIYGGFGGETPQVFVGLTEGMPVLDEKAKTARFHCIDFLSFVFNNQLDETALFTNQRVDQIISSLLQGAGLSTLQMSLETAYTTIPYAFFDKGAKLGDALNELVQAELGRLYMDENGVITFENRQSFSDVSVHTFDNSNTLDFKQLQFDQIANVVEVKSKVLDVQANQKVFELSQATFVPAGETIEIWADFQDPVTSIDTPVNIASATTSLWQANTLEDGSGADYTDISLDDFDLFSKSYKMTFENTGASDAYIRSVVLFGTPVKPIAEIYERQTDAASVTAFEERVMTIENKFIQTSTTARSLAILIATIQSDFSGVSEMQVKGTPALQLGDPISLDVTHQSVIGGRWDSTVITWDSTEYTWDSTGSQVDQDYYVSKIENTVSEGSYGQKLKVQRRLSLDTFTLDQSELDGADTLGP